MLRNLGIISRKNEQGLASIVVVGVLIALLTVISLGFARIMDRTVKTALNDQTSAAASYAAQSGINDLATYIRTNPSVNATGCKDLIGTSGTPGPFYTSSNLSGDRNSEYTCILLDQRPDTVAYQKIETLKSKVIKLTTEAATGSVDRLLFSWQSSSGETPRKNITPAPVSARLPDATTWNQADYIPMVRLTLYPVKTSASVSTVQQESRTIFLYPNPHTIANEAIDFSSIGEGSIQSVGCRGPDKDAPGFVGQALLDCNIAINGLASIPDIDYFYIRIVPIYNSVDFEVKAKDIDDRKIRFTGVQAVLDVTAKVGPASKRLQARVDIGGNTGDVSNPIEPSPNVSPEDAAIPDFSLRTANAICKRTLFHDTPYAYVTFEGNPTSCQAGGLVDIPNAAITYFRINGIDDTTPTPAPYTGVSYIAAGDTANLTWQTTDAIACEGSRGTGAWLGNKVPPIMTWAGSVGTGSQSIGGITNVTYFDLRCSGPDSTTSTRTVTAWPPPTVSFSGSTTSYEAGQNYTIRYTSTNSSRCDMTSTGNKPWSQSYTGITESGGSTPTDSRTFATDWNDNTDKTYTITCRDPDGRVASDTHTVGTNPSSDTRTNPPYSLCYADWNVSDNGNGTGTLTWSGSCPTVSPGSGYYQFHSCNAELSPYTNGCSWVGNGRVDTVGVGTYCGNYRSGADPWGWLADSGPKCFIVTMPPVTLDWISVGDYIWWENNYAGTCRIPDAAGHSWFVCSIGVSVRQSGTTPGDLSCRLFANGGGIGTWSGSGGSPGNSFVAPTSSNSNEVNRWQVGYFGTKYGGPFVSPAIFRWECSSARGGAPYNSGDIVRFPNWPP